MRITKKAAATAPIANSTRVAGTTQRRFLVSSDGKECGRDAHDRQDPDGHAEPLEPNGPRRYGEQRKEHRVQDHRRMDEQRMGGSPNARLISSGSGVAGSISARNHGRRLRHS